jgi:predicted nuclease with TOPRIM domain
MDGMGHENMLSAEEKISELKEMVEQAEGEASRLRQELEDVQAEKVSLEFILREKLEKMVQSEIQDRVEEMRRDMVPVFISASDAHRPPSRNPTHPHGAKFRG